MAIEDRDTVLIRAELQRRHDSATQERLARAAHREAALQARAVQTANLTNPQEAPATPTGRFGWLRRLAG